MNPGCQVTHDPIFIAVRPGKEFSVLSWWRGSLRLICQYFTAWKLDGKSWI